MRLVWWIALGVAAALAGRPPQQQPAPLKPADFIVAGLTDDADSAAVVRALGKPDSIARFEVANGEAEMADWFYRDIRVSLNNGGFFGVTLRGPRFVTARGLRVGDAADKVVRLYGTASDTTDGVWTYPDPARHDFLHTIDFMMQGRVVRSIYLGWTID